MSASNSPSKAGGQPVKLIKLRYGHTLGPPIQQKPVIKIKEEVIEEEPEEYACARCHKSFFNQMALCNHLWVQHTITDFKSATILIKKEPSQPASETPDEDSDGVARNSENLMSSLKPASLVSLASENVSYIIVKADKIPQRHSRKKEGAKKQISSSKISESFAQDQDGEVDTEKRIPRTYTKPSKEPIDLNGPFECLQPSTKAPTGSCHQIFFNCCEYSAHYRDEHTKRRKLSQRCQVCEKPLELTFPTGVELPYRCQVNPECGRGFHTQELLKIHHESAHVKYKPHVCNICQKRFRQLSGIQQHMRMHTGDRPYKCTFCPKGFTQKSGLDQHKRTHTKDKPYQCVICKKSFVQSVHLKQHMRTHTNITPFECGICGRRYKQSSHLNFHLKSHPDTEVNGLEQEKISHEDVTRVAIQSIEGYGKEEEQDLEPIEVELAEDVEYMAVEEDDEDNEVTVIVEQDPSCMLEDGTYVFQPVLCDEQ